MHGTMHEHAAPSVAVIDPLNRSGKIDIPLSKVLETKGLTDSLTGQRSCGPQKDLSLCLLYQRGRCNAGPKCHQIHADAAFVAALRERSACCSNCCAVHGDPHSAPLLNAQTVAAVDALAIGDATIPIGHFALTGALEALLAKGAAPTGPVLNCPVSRVCRLHLTNRCKFGRDCKNIHLCRQKSAAVDGNASTAVMDATSAVSPLPPRYAGATNVLPHARSNMHMQPQEPWMSAPVHADLPTDQHQHHMYHQQWLQHMHSMHMMQQAALAAAPHHQMFGFQNAQLQQHVHAQMALQHMAAANMYAMQHQQQHQQQAAFDCMTPPSSTPSTPRSTPSHCASDFGAGMHPVPMSTTSSARTSPTEHSLCLFAPTPSMDCTAVNWHWLNSTCMPQSAIAEESLHDECADAPLPRALCFDIVQDLLAEDNTTSTADLPSLLLDFQRSFDTPASPTATTSENWNVLTGLAAHM